MDYAVYAPRYATFFALAKSRRLYIITICPDASSLSHHNVQVCSHISRPAYGRADKLPMCRPLGQLFFSSDILSGEEAAKLRSYCTEAWINFDKDFKDPCGILIEDADLTAFQDYFQGRVQHFDGRQHEAAQETYKLRWGPTRIPIYVALLAFTTLNPPRRYKYFAIAEWLVDTAKVPVDGM